MQIDYQHVVSFLTGALALYGALRVVAPITQTTKDDELVRAAENTKRWIEGKAPIIWSLVEVASKVGKLPDSVSKTIYFLELLKKAYADAHQTSLPKDAEALAHKIAQQISNEAKKL